MKNFITIFSFFILVLFFPFVFSVSGSGVTEYENLSPTNPTPKCAWGKALDIKSSDGGHADYFGQSVNLKEEIAAVGAPYHNGGLGAVYLFGKENGVWSEKEKLDVSDLYGKWDHPSFGNDLSLSGNKIAVGAYEHNGAGFNQGAVYVFEKKNGSWELEGIITPSDKADEKYFGSSVEMEGGTLVVGALGYDSSGGYSSGSVYVFEREEGSWVEKQKITPPNPAPLNYFGDGIALDQNQLIVLSRLNDMFAEDGGAVFYYKHDGEEWVLEQSFSASDVKEGSQFGWSASVLGDVLAVGSIMSNTCGSFSGSIYVFEKEGGEWVEEVELQNSDCQPVSMFGGNISVGEERILAGAQALDVDGLSNSGAIYLFEREDGVWDESEVFYEPNSGDHHNFGSSVDLSGESFIAGAHFSEVGDINPGQAYIYNKDCRRDVRCSVYLGQQDQSNSQIFEEGSLCEALS